MGALFTLGVALLAAGPWPVNPGFETTQPAKPGADGKVSGWTIDAPGELPANWTLNTSYPGHLSVVPTGSHSGAKHVKLTAPAGREAHLYQMCNEVEQNRWYRVSAWLKGGTGTILVYEYYTDAIRGRVLVTGTAPADQWQRLEGFYRPGGEGFQRYALALACRSDGSVEFDDVAVEPLQLPETKGEPITFEDQLVRMELGAEGGLRALVAKATGQDYAAPTAPVSLLRARLHGTELPLHSLTREGDRLVAQFLDPKARVVLQVQPLGGTFLFKVVEAQPAELENLSFELPVKRLENVSGALNAVYDNQFGIALFTTAINAYNSGRDYGGDVRSLQVHATREHGLVGASWALVAAPWSGFKAELMMAEQASGLPCPKDGRDWLRDGEMVRKSYLFATSVVEQDIDTLIDYAKLGGFGTIIILKNDWLANHGHFEVNPKAFPDGVAGLKRAVDKIHAAGLDAGVHVFGPSVSADDPYVTPIPNDGLASFDCPPLAEAIDAKATTLTLTGQANVPPLAPSSRAFPGNTLRLGDELIRYANVEVGPPFRFTGCQRGALGTTAAAHPAGGDVKGLMTIWGFFAVDPDSELADEVCRNFAKVFNACGFDFVYFDASDGIVPGYGLDRWYYLNRMHLGYWRAIGRDVLYQTSNGTGSNLLWHIVPRSASADGHGDIKGYLDDRWPGILGMGRNFTKADIGWYYWFREVRPDQLEYVCAKALGVDGSISLETSREALDRLSQSRQMMEMLGRWEHCRAEGPFGDDVKASLREPQHDFKVVKEKGRWRLYRAYYESPRLVDQLDGKQNVWTIGNDLPSPTQLGFELERGTRQVATRDYQDKSAVTIAPLDDATPFAVSEFNDSAKFVQGGGRVMSPTGPVRTGVSQTFETSTDPGRDGKSLVYRAENSGANNGWCGIGQRFKQPLDLSGAAGVGLWVKGDAQAEQIRFQLWDTKGKVANWMIPITFEGWRLFTFALPDAAQFDRGQVAYLLFYFNNVSMETKVEVRLDDVRALQQLRPPEPMGELTLTIDGRPVKLPVRLAERQTVAYEGTDGVKLWPGGMTPSQPVRLETSALALEAGQHRIELTCEDAAFPGDLSVLLYRVTPYQP